MGRLHHPHFGPLSLFIVAPFAFQVIPHLVFVAQAIFSNVTFPLFVVRKRGGIDAEEELTLTQALVDVAEDVYDTLASRVAYSEGTVLPRWKLRSNPNATTEPATKPTFEQFIKAYERTIMTALNLNDADDLRLIDDNGLFPAHDNVPQSRRFASPKLGGLSNNLINTLVTRVDELANRLSKV